MCTILLAWRCLADTPIILAANRDELIARASAPPGVLSTSPLVMGGRDLVAGGTWLAVTATGTGCAVTNRHPATGKPQPPDPTRRSRGEIPLALLTDVDARDIPARLAVLGPGRYNPVNVVWVSADRALVAFDEIGQTVKNVRRQRDQSIAAPQFARRRINTEITKNVYTMAHWRKA